MDNTGKGIRQLGKDIWLSPSVPFGIVKDPGANA